MRIHPYENPSLGKLALILLFIVIMICIIVVLVLSRDQMSYHAASRIEPNELVNRTWNADVPQAEQLLKTPLKDQGAEGIVVCLFRREDQYYLNTWLGKQGLPLQIWYFKNALDPETIAKWKNFQVQCICMDRAIPFVINHKASWIPLCLFLSSFQRLWYLDIKTLWIATSAPPLTQSTFWSSVTDKRMLSKNLCFISKQQDNATLWNLFRKMEYDNSSHFLDSWPYLDLQPELPGVCGHDSDRLGWLYFYQHQPLVVVFKDQIKPCNWYTNFRPPVSSEAYLSGTELRGGESVSTAYEIPLLL